MFLFLNIILLKFYFLLVQADCLLVQSKEVHLKVEESERIFGSSSYNTIVVQGQYLPVLKLTAGDTQDQS